MESQLELVTKTVLAERPNATTVILRKSRRRKRSLQSRIAQRALSIMFDEKRRRAGKRSSIPVNAGTFIPEKLDACLAYLEENTGSGLAIDPFKSPDGTSWTIVSQRLSSAGLRPVALEIASRYADVCYRLQGSMQQRIHKAAPLFLLSECLRGMEEMETARGSMLLAFVEDLIAGVNPHESATYRSLVGALDVSSKILESITDISRTQAQYFYPEELLVRWELSNAPHISLLRPKKQSSVWAIRPLYALPFNLPLVNQSTNLVSAGQDEDGQVLETLVTYLFLTVPGLTVKNRQVGKGGEVDVLVGNLAAPGAPLRWFGDYFLVECKDKGQPVSESEFGHFLTKLNLTKTKQGAIFSRFGLSGSSGRSYTSRDQRIAFSEMGVSVLDIRVADIRNLTSREDFLMLLHRKYEELRFH